MNIAVIWFASDAIAICTPMSPGRSTPAVITHGKRMSTERR
jgi:hypothetical protein